MLAYLGPKGTFSHQAASEVAADNEILTEYGTISDVISAVNDGKAHRGIVPIENSIEGAINTTLDMLAFNADLFITGEHILCITQNIMAKKGTSPEDIRLITSHPQAIGQCTKILRTKYKHVKTEFADSTASAAKRAAESDGSIACIGSASSAQIYGLDILDKSCVDDPTNRTRFIILEKKPSLKVSPHDKSSIAFTLSNKPGSLYEALELFAGANINMTKIESRPVKTHLGEYIFFIDIDGNIDDARIYFALDKLKQNTLFYKFLGSYKKDIS